MAYIMYQIKNRLLSIFPRFLGNLTRNDGAYIPGEPDLHSPLEARLDTVIHLIDNLHKSTSTFHIDNIVLTHPKYKDERCLSTSRGQVYSQNNEDGIIDEIFRRIGVDSKKFIEIAAGDGIENTTRLLLETGWSGIWVEGGKDEADCINHVVHRSITEGTLNFIEEMITLENIDDILVDRVDFIPDYISIDIDYNTSHIWRKLMKLKPRVFCIEYNAHYPPNMIYEVPYKSDGVWEGTTRFGASLKALEMIGRDHGYSLVCCDILGINAFFVRDDLCCEKLFYSPFAAENHYEPPRYYNVFMRGHRRQIRFE